MTIIRKERAIRIGDFELGVRQGHAGIGGADLADQQVPVRHILEAHCNDRLLTAVRQIDGLGALEDAVPVRRVNFLHDV